MSFKDYWNIYLGTIADIEQKHIDTITKDD